MGKSIFWLIRYIMIVVISVVIKSVAYYIQKVDKLIFKVVITPDVLDTNIILKSAGVTYLYIHDLYNLVDL